jgi:pimeloyl-ACP methyl ester carboxylesterase
MSTVDIDGLRVNYEREGSGPVIVFLHGHGGNLTLFNGLTVWLKRDYTVLRYDQRGYGQTEKPFRSPYSTQLWADDLHRLLVRLGIEEAVVGGHSMSGRICATFAADHPEIVKGLITFNTTWFGANAEAAAALESGAERIEEEGMTPVLRTSRSLNSIPGDRREVRKFVEEMLLKNDPRSYALGSRAVALDFKGGSREDLLGSVECPTQIVIGDRDSAPLEGALMMLRGIETSRLAVIPGSGHYGILEKPELIEAVLADFLRVLGQ